MIDFCPLVGVQDVYSNETDQPFCKNEMEISLAKLFPVHSLKTFFVVLGKGCGGDAAKWLDIMILTFKLDLLVLSLLIKGSVSDVKGLLHYIICFCWDCTDNHVFKSLDVCGAKLSKQYSGIYLVFLF